MESIVEPLAMVLGILSMQQNGPKGVEEALATVVQTAVKANEMEQADGDEEKATLYN